MEAIKAEYKKTKVGSIPSEWEVKKFGDVFDFIKTSSHSKNQMTYDDTETEIYNVHYGAIHTTYKEQILDFEKYNVPRITDDSPMPKMNQCLTDGDLVIVDASEDWDGLGECVELKNVGGKKVIGGLHTYAVRDSKGIFAKGFAGYIFQNTAVRNRLASYANVSKVYGITKGNISIVPLVIPTLPEQYKIAEILSTVDEQIRATERIIEKSKELKKGLMQKLFSEGIGHAEFKDTKIGRIPKDWEVKRLKEVGKVITSGISFDKFESNRTDRGVKVLFTKVSDMNLSGNERVLLSSVNQGLFSREFVDSNTIVKPDSLIFPKRGAAIKTNKKRICGEHIVLDPNLIAVSLDSDKANYLFVYYFIMTFDLMRIVEDGTIPQLNKRDIEPFQIPLPSLDEQQKIAEILSEADKKIENEEQYKIELVQLKKGLMQQLLTGQKRVRI